MRLVERRDAWPHSSTLGLAAARAESYAVTKAVPTTASIAPRTRSFARVPVQFSLGEKMIIPRTTKRAEFAGRRGFSECNQSCIVAISERENISLAQQGDPLAFERIYRLHSARVYALCLRMVGNTAEAEDLTQEAFLMVLRKIRTFRGESALSTWLHRIAVNLVLMRLRKKSSLETSLGPTSEQDGERSCLPEEFAAADLFLAGSLDRLNLERALEQLHPCQRVVVVLHDIQGYKHTEIAKLLDWSIGNSKSRLHRARARLRKLLQESFRFDCIRPTRTAQAAFGV
jgi:RNA polymerase sigma-70 factor (ECF subfamily)